MNRPRVSRPSVFVALLLILLVVAGSLALAACGGKSTAATSSASPRASAAVVATAPSTTPLPAATGRGLIAFSKGTLSGPVNMIGSLGLYVVRSDGAGLRRLAADGRHPAWSPDGSKIAYLDSEGVSIMNADGSAKRVVTEAVVRGGFAGGARVAWSPDGRQLVFNEYVGDTTRPEERTRSLFIVNSDGSGRRRLTTGEAGTSDDYPAWTSDGQIFFTRLSKGGYSMVGQLCRVCPDGSGIAVVMTVAVPLRPFFSLSPDGRWLLMDWSNRLVRLAADGHGKKVTLLENLDRFAKGGEHPAFFAAAPSWSPDGAKIVVGADERAGIGPAGLYVLNANGSGVRRLPRAGLGWNPAWQPR